jgi:hypothetical protein
MMMNAKKLVVGFVTAVTLTLFTAAVYAQQPMPTQEDTAQTPAAHQEERGVMHEHHVHEHHGRA